MKITCNRLALSQALIVAHEITSGKLLRPDLKNISLKVDDGVLIIKATDSECSAVARVTEITGEDCDAVILDAETLNDIIAKVPDDMIKTDQDDSYLSISGDECRFRVKIAPASLPEPHDLGDLPVAKITASSLLRIIQLTRFAAMKEASNYPTNCLLLKFDQANASATASDGKRIAVAETECETSSKKHSLVPLKAIDALAKVLAGRGESEVQIRVEDEAISFQIDEFTISSQLLEGAYPNIEELIPKDGRVTINANRSSFAEAVTLASLMSSSDSPAIRLHIGAKGIKLEHENPMSGDAKINFPCKCKGGSMLMGFNHRFLSQWLGASDGEEIEILIQAADKPALFRSNGHQYVVMPMNVSKGE